MFENIINFFKKLNKTEKSTPKSKDAAKERLHLVLVQDRANVSADFLDLMRKEIIDVIRKYIEIDDSDIDVQLTNMQKEDGTVGAPVLHANIPIVKIKNEAKKKIEGKTENSENTTNEDDTNEKAENESIKTDKNEKVKEEEKNEESTQKPEKEPESQKEIKDTQETNIAENILKEVAEIIKEENKKD